MSKGCRLEEACSNNRRWDPRGVHRNGFKPVHESGDPVLWGFSPGPESGDLKTTGVQLALRKTTPRLSKTGSWTQVGLNLASTKVSALLGLNESCPYQGLGFCTTQSRLPSSEGLGLLICAFERATDRRSPPGSNGPVVRDWYLGAHSSACAQRCRGAR